MLGRILYIMVIIQYIYIYNWNTMCLIWSLFVFEDAGLEMEDQWFPIDLEFVAKVRNLYIVLFSFDLPALDLNLEFESSTKVGYHKSIIQRATTSRYKVFEYRWFDQNANEIEIWYWMYFTFQYNSQYVQYKSWLCILRYFS